MKLGSAALAIAVAGIVCGVLGGCSQNQPSSTSAPSPSAPEASPPQASAPPQPVAGQGPVYNGLTMTQLKAIFATAGRTAEDAQTAPAGGLLRLQGGPLVLLTQCPDDEHGTCYEIEISRTFSNVKPTVEAVNQWNSNTKIPEASVDPSGNLHMEFWVTTVGMTDQLLLDSIGWFEVAWQDPDAQQFWQPYMSGPNS